MSEERKVVITMTERTVESVDIDGKFFPVVFYTEYSLRTVFAEAALQAIREEIKKYAEEEKEQNS